MGQRYTPPKPKEEQFCAICEKTCSKNKKSVFLWERRAHRICLKEYMVSLPPSPQREAIQKVLFDLGYTHERSTREVVFFHSKTYLLDENGNYKEEHYGQHSQGKG